MTDATADRIEREHAQVLKHSRREPWIPIGLLAAVLAYFAYAWIAFDMTSLVASIRMDRAVILATDSFAHKIHIERDFAKDETEISVEGQRDNVFETPPDWVTVEGNAITIDMGGGYRVEIRDRTTTVFDPDGTSVTAVSNGEEVLVEGDIPEDARVNERKFEMRPTLFRRVQVLRNSVEVHRYFTGWENFWFDGRSPLHGMSLFGALGTMFSSERLDQEMSNAALVFHEFWNNREWQHGDVFVALLETVIMAFLGTALASMLGLPLAFLAAANFNRITILRLGVRRLFDFVRAIDHLIWSLIFIRAFGLGPLSGIMAIFFTDTGTLGKLFSEAIENIDNKPVDGVTSTGAKPTQRYRVGVIPQILPVFISQSLYYLESNTRSATIIGALGAGGIGLKLVETLRTGVDWENTLYIITLTVIVVFAMDIFSGWLRRKLV